MSFLHKFNMPHFQDSIIVKSILFTNYQLIMGKKVILGLVFEALAHSCNGKLRRLPIMTSASFISITFYFPKSGITIYLVCLFTFFYSLEYSLKILNCISSCYVVVPPYFCLARIWMSSLTYFVSSLLSTEIGQLLSSQNFKSIS